MKKLYGVIEIKRADGEKPVIFQVKSTTRVKEFPNGDVECKLDIFDKKIEAKEFYKNKLRARQGKM